MNDTEQVVISFNDEGRRIILFNLHILAKLTEACINFNQTSHVSTMLHTVRQGLVDLGEMIDGRDALDALNLSWPNGGN